MALAGGWFDVIGTRGFIFLALRAGHNATFVTIGGDARRRFANARRTIRQSRWEMAIASASASRWKIGGSKEIPRQASVVRDLAT